MSKINTDFVVIGKIGSTYGVRGWLKVFSFTEKMIDILNYFPWYIEENKTWKTIEIKTGREHGKSLVIHFDGYDSPESARVLTGKKIAIKRSQLPVLSKDEYYWNDLIGLKVVNIQGEDLGQICHLIETGSNDVLVVTHQGQEYAIPYLNGTVIKKVDLPNQLVQVDWDLN